jgi:hypothetical protein
MQRGRRGKIRRTRGKGALMKIQLHGVIVPLSEDSASFMQAEDASIGAIGVLCQSTTLLIIVILDLMPRMSVSVDAYYNGSVAQVKMKACGFFDAKRTAAREKRLGVHWMTISDNPFVIVILRLRKTPERIWMSRDGPKSAKSMLMPTEVTQYHQIQQTPGGTELLC